MLCVLTMMSQTERRDNSMIDRYTRPQMSAIWDIQTQVRDLAGSRAASLCGIRARRADSPWNRARIRKKATIDVARIAEIEKVTKHDVIAFLESLMDSVGPEHRFLHMGLTSSDIVDTSLGGANDRSAGSDPRRS